jgi:hypothetical protein
MTIRPRPWWWPWKQPDPPDSLNEPDEDHSVAVPSRLDWHGNADETVNASPEAADQWDARRWSPRL